MHMVQKMNQQIMREIILAIEQAGYNPYNQILGYLQTGIISYITRNGGARNKIKLLDRTYIWQYISAMKATYKPVSERKE